MPQGFSAGVSLRYKVVSVVFLAAFSTPLLRAQTLFPDVSFAALASWQSQEPNDPLGSNSAVGIGESPSIIGTSTNDSQGKQTKRILGLVPNFQAVSADTYLPPLPLKQKVWLATKSSFDYSSFVFVGMQAAVEETTNTYPEFHQGAAGFGRYYWHIFTDQAVGNYFTGAIFAAVTREDPRYYTLFHGSFMRRVRYAMSRIVITRNDAGADTFNFSEVLGNGAATLVSGYYYPVRERADVPEFFERWATQLLTDAFGNIFTEFWPDINHKFFHKR